MNSIIHMTLRKKIILGVILGIFLIPFPTTVAPEMKFTVVDKSNNPLPGIGVKQNWQAIPIQASNRSEIKFADQLGKVVFEKRVAWSNVLIWILAVSEETISLGLNTSFGSYWRVNARRGCYFGTISWNDPKDVLTLNKRMNPDKC
jgi:hypothetical protein